ncbi:D-alanyl-D-alanine carboxypeptidase-like protein [hydrothermal vent metagenome]|uniref:D-alanyl-D-alanine carboxypeptidase-like protein n=1 Tax=hydrothermal vent metagenome TaxID=652676 RepID=A0A3B0SZ65_9ZZZZ
MKKLKVLYLILPIIIFQFACSKSDEKAPQFGEDFDREKMDLFFLTIEEKNLGMGSISISKNGQLDYQASYGKSDISNGISATAQTKYRIASITKTFTASIIMQLIEENKLALNTKLDNFFTEIPNSSSITIENLLRHRSGLFNYTNTPYSSEIVTQPATQEELIALFIENGTVFQPDEKTEYSNTNYVLLSFIIEDLDEKSYSNTLEDRIINPLALSNTYNGGLIDTTNEEALSYNRQSDDWILASETNLTLAQGAGSIVSNPNDLNTFYQALFDGKVVSESSLQEMKKMVDGVGIGLFPIPFNDKNAFGHSGQIDGFQSISMHFPDENVTISYTFNGVSMPSNDVLIGALSIYSNLEYTLP